ncbi:MAG: hypothetical protein JXO44_02705 [Clostridia bacterium]|nr:hypothetical protein [Clostridia bacterium]
MKQIIDKFSTRQWLMAGIVVAFVMTLILGNYGVYTHVAHERYVVKEALMDTIEENVQIMRRSFEQDAQALEIFKSWFVMELSDQQARSIIEDYHMSSMSYDEDIERTYNAKIDLDEADVLMLYKDYLKSMPTDLRIEVNRVFEGYKDQAFIQQALAPSAKLVLSSPFGYTAITPYDEGIDGNGRSDIVAYYEHFLELESEDLDRWRVETVPGEDGLYYGKTVQLNEDNSQRYLLTILFPVEELRQRLHTFEQNYEFSVISGSEAWVIENFQTVTPDAVSLEHEGVLSSTEFLEGATYPFMKKIKNDYVVGHPISGTDWKALAVFDEAAIGKNTLLKTGGFYLLNLMFIGIFAFLVVMVNRHLTEQEK